VFILSVLRISAKKREAKNIKKQPSAAPSPPYLRPFDFTTCQQRLFRVSHYHSTLHYCLSVLILDLSAAYLELHIFLRQANFVSPGNRFSNLSRVPSVGCRSPCVRGKNR
jgi:hypothetical protein